MLNKKIVLILSIVAVLILLVLSGYYFWQRSRPLSPTTQPPASGDTTLNQNLPSTGGEDNRLSSPGNQPGDKNKPTPQELDVSAAQQTAKFFVEMLGTYSSDGNFKNIIDLQPMMTDKMLAWSNDFIKRNNNENEIGQYQSVTTKVFSSQVLSGTGQWVEILVKTRRHEIIGGEEKNYNQEAKVVLKKINSNWLVDGVNWQ